MFNKENFKNFVTKSEKYKETDEMKYIENETRSEIFNFQAEKEKLISQMHELLQKADNGEEISFGEKDLISVGIDDNNNYKTFGKKGGIISKGDIAIASIWNKHLKLNSEIDRGTKKKFILRETKRKIQDLWDKQLTLGIKDSKETNHINSVSGLEKSSEFNATEDYEKMSGGHLAEKMVNSFFTKILANNPELPFTMEQGDVFDDALEKMDFIFHIKKDYSRALNIEACGEKIEKDCTKTGEIGIQYTMNDKKNTQEKKLDQIEKSKKRNDNKFDDIILVTVPLNKMHNAIKEWRNSKIKNNFSGPERFLNKEVIINGEVVSEKEFLFKTMLNNLPAYLNINPEKYWDKIKDQV